ncbi:MAG: hypothetical protein QOG67_262 [Verrucomicrobiota bacterium]
MLGQAVRLHPFGFFYASETVTAEEKVRFHLWPNGWAVPLQEHGRELHDHNYELYSLIISGALRNETFTTKPAFEDGYEVYVTSYTADGSKLTRTNDVVSVEPRTDVTYPTGKMYRLSPGIVHRVTPQQFPAATIVLTAMTKGAGHARVLIKGGCTGSQRFDRSLLTTEDERRALDALNGLQR